MDYQTLYRRWRPRKFADFVGQNHVVTTLSNALEEGKVAHAFLFTGPRGTGKTSIAKIFAKALNCENLHHGEPCDECSSCSRINAGNFMDVLEIDAASNRGIDEIRDLREKVKFAPTEGKYKIYIIDEVHMLTAEAFNALLKTLEEPPQFVVFILATTESHKIPATILSRCQRFDFKRFTVPEITGRLLQIIEAEGVNASKKALELIAVHAEGGMRDALSLLEQALSHSHGQLEETDVRAILGLIDEEEINRITLAIKNRNTVEALTVLTEINLGGKDLYQFGRSLVEHFRELLLSALTGESSNPIFLPGELVKIIEIISGAAGEVKRSQQSALPLELALIKLTALNKETDLEARVCKLERMLQGKEPVAAPNLPELPEKAAAVTAPPVEPLTSQKPAQVGVSLPSNEAGFSQWGEFLEIIKKKKRTLAALIQEGKPLGVHQGELVVTFPPNLKFHLENLALPNNKELLESILKEVCGQAVKINCVPNNQNTKVEAEPAQPDILKQTVAIFGGEVCPVKKEDI